MTVRNNPYAISQIGWNHPNINGVPKHNDFGNFYF